jgi:hypothetical protein
VEWGQHVLELSLSDFQRPEGRKGISGVETLLRARPQLTIVLWHQRQADSFSPGSGLGLSIVCELSNRSGGAVSVTSRSGEGENTFAGTGSLIEIQLIIASVLARARQHDLKTHGSAHDAVRHEDSGCNGFCAPMPSSAKRSHDPGATCGSSAESGAPRTVMPCCAPSAA